MLTFEKVLKVFQAYLDDAPLYEVVQTIHGYTSVSYTHLDVYKRQSVSHSHFQDAVLHNNNRSIKTLKTFHALTECFYYRDSSDIFLSLIHIWVLLSSKSPEKI